MIKSSKVYVTRYLFIFLALCVMIFIFWHSSRDAIASTDQSDSFAKNLFSWLDSDFASMDENEQQSIIVKTQYLVRKSAHFCIYAALGFLVLGAVNTYTLTNPVKLLVSFGLCVVYSISDEIHQIFVPGRAGRVSDVLIDTGGILLGIVVMAGFILLYTKVKRRGETK